MTPFLVRRFGPGKKLASSGIFISHYETKSQIRNFLIVTQEETSTRYSETPDGRYLLVRGRLWRKSNPSLGQAVRQELVHELMSARRAVRNAKDDDAAKAAARKRVNDAKVSLGERGAVWWDDDAPDYNRHLVKNTAYVGWFAKQKL